MNDQCTVCGKPALGGVNISVALPSSVPSLFEMRCEDHGMMSLNSLMTPSRYVEQAMTFASADRAERFAEMLNLCGLGLAGEGGEVADLVKKFQHHRVPFDKEKLIKEAGDVCWYLALWIVPPMIHMSRDDYELWTIYQQRKIAEWGFSFRLFKALTQVPTYSVSTTYHPSTRLAYRMSLSPLEIAQNVNDAYDKKNEHAIQEYKKWLCQHGESI